MPCGPVLPGGRVWAGPLQDSARPRSRCPKRVSLRTAPGCVRPLTDLTVARPWALWPSWRARFSRARRQNGLRGLGAASPCQGETDSPLRIVSGASAWERKRLWPSAVSRPGLQRHRRRMHRQVLRRTQARCTRETAWCLCAVDGLVSDGEVWSAATCERGTERLAGALVRRVRTVRCVSVLSTGAVLLTTCDSRRLCASCASSHLPLRRPALTRWRTRTPPQSRGG